MLRTNFILLKLAFILRVSILVLYCNAHSWQIWVLSGKFLISNSMLTYFRCGHSSIQGIQIVTEQVFLIVEHFFSTLNHRRQRITNTSIIEPLNAQVRVRYSDQMFTLWYGVARASSTQFLRSNYWTQIRVCSLSNVQCRIDRLKVRISEYSKARQAHVSMQQVRQNIGILSKTAEELVLRRTGERDGLVSID